MNPTWVMDFPDGYETGTYLALDMGGTNLRVCEITLTENKSEFDIIQSKIGTISGREASLGAVPLSSFASTLIRPRSFPPRVMELRSGDSNRAVETFLANCTTILLRTLVPSGPGC